MKKLMFFSSDFKIGLAELLSDQLAAIHKSGIDYVAVAGDNEQIPGLWKKVEDAGYNIVKIPNLDRHDNYKSLVKVLSEIADNNNVEVIHVQNNWQLALAAGIKRKVKNRKLEIVYTLHGFRNNHPVKAVIAQVVIGSALNMFARRVICMTEYLRRKFRFLGNKRILLPLGISDDCFVGDFTYADKKGLQMIFPAQFRVGKNQDLIIRAFAHHINKTGDRDSRLVLPGGGDLLDGCKKLAKSLGIEDRISFPGFITRKEVIDLYRESNIAIVASNSETFGQSIVEPYVMGRCVVSTNVGIAPEIIKDDVNGYIFDGEEQLSNIMTRLYKNQDKIRAIGECNYKLRDAFRWSSIIERYKQLILN